MRFLPLVTATIVLVLFEFFFFYPKAIYVSLALSGLAIFFALWQLAKTSFVDKRWWNFFILPAVFMVGLAAYSMALSGKFFIQFLFLSNAIFIYFYLRFAYCYLIQPVLHREQTFDNVFSGGNFLAFFFAASAVYSLQSFLNAPTWLLMSVLVAVTALAVYQSMWANKIDIGARYVYILAACLIIFELGWAISFLPVNYNIAGLVLAACYHIFTGLSKLYLLEKLNKKSVKAYLVFGFLSIFFVLLTARWV